MSPDLKFQLATLASKANEACDQANALVKGRRVRILSDYNGQPFGLSKPSKRGAHHKVMSVIFSWGSGFELFLEGERLAIGIDEVEFIGDEESR